jgi:serine/threonine-protein kinase
MRRTAGRVSLMAEHDEPLVGALIAGKYRVKRRIGAGGMGAVYEGEHVEIGKRVAIKVIESQHARSAELAARFRREARAASAVESEHIVQVFDVGQDDTIGLYMVMELLVGEDLAARLENAGGRIPVEEAVTLIAQAGRALGKAHAAGVVHRDLKPANLFLTTREDGSTSVKILDFGISKLVRPDAGTEGGAAGGAKTSLLTREGAVMGTPIYMSPEQAQGLPVDARSDVWSLASVLYEAIAGRTAYDARDTYEQMIVQIVTQKPRPIEEVAPWVPAPVARVLEAALAHDVAARTSDAGAFAKSLTAAVRDAGAPASSPDAPAAPSSSRLRVESSGSSAASPAPTGTGVVVGARAVSAAEGAPKRGRTAVIVASAVAVVGAIALFAVVTREPAPKPIAQGGLVAAPPPPASLEPTASASASAPAPLVVTKLLPASASAAPEPTAAPSLAKPAHAPDAGTTRSGVRPSSTTATQAQPTTTTTKPSGPSQYGAAGVSTAY